jgi:mannose-6-phosphate isomerase-like protein (cupin superfamily)
MRVYSSSEASLIPEFGIMSGRWTQYGDTGSLPFGAMWLRVEPGGSAHTDNHPERELMIVVRGSAEVRLSDGTHRVGPGSVALLESRETHVLANASAEEPLVALSLYWIPQDGTDAAVRGDAEPAAGCADGR